MRHPDIDSKELCTHRAWVARQLRRGAPGYHEIVTIVRGAETVSGTGWLKCGRLAVGYTGLLLLFALIPLLLLAGYWLLALAAVAVWTYILRPLQYRINGELAARVLTAKAASVRDAAEPQPNRLNL